MMKRAKKQIFCGFLVFCVMIMLISGESFAASEEMQEATPTTCCYDCLRAKYSIEDIRQMFNDGEQIYRDLRVHYEDVGVVTYRVPAADSEIEHLLNTVDGNIQPRSTSNFERTKIIDSGLPHDESIVIAILGDAFDRDDYGTWPDPDEETVLWHAYDVINTMLDTHPFGLFRDLFTVYVVHSYGPDRRAGHFAGYFGTIMADPSSRYYGALASWDTLVKLQR